MKRFLYVASFLFMSLMLWSQKVDISMNLAKGETYHLKMNTNSSVHQEINGNKIDIKMTILGDISYQIEDFVEDVYTMNVAYENMTMSMDIPQKGTMTFSSDSANSSNPASAILSALTKHTFQVKMSKKGEVKEVTGMDSLMSAVFSKVPNANSAQMAQLSSQIEKSYGKESFKNNLGMVMSSFPANKVGVGESWEYIQNLNGIFPMNTSTTYTLSEIKSELLLIKGVSTISIDNAPILTSGMTMKYNIQGDMNSEVNLDRKTGWVKSAKVVQIIQGEMIVQKSENDENPMKIPMAVTSVISFED